MEPTQFWGQLKMGPTYLWGSTQPWGQFNHGAISTVGPTKFWGQLNIGAKSVLGPTEAHSANYLGEFCPNLYLAYP
jgi:hypothetical protein